MGGSSAKGGGGSTQTYDYYGTIAAIIRAGPIDTLHCVLRDGKNIWSGPISRTDAGVTNPYTLLLTNSNLVHGGGYVRLYWGDDDQTVADPALTGHPPYRGFAYMVFHKFLFGRERTMAPDIEVVAEALPRPPAAVIPATAADGTTGCVNPIAILAELLTSIHGASLPVARLDAASWQATHDFMALTSARRLLSYCAPLLTSQSKLSSICEDLLSLCDAGMRLKTDGTIEVYCLPPDPGDLAQYTSLTANDLTEPVSVETSTWDKVPTGVVVQFTDGVRWDKESSLKVDDLRALQQALEPQREDLKLPFVIREEQARQIAAEWVKRNCQPQGSGTISVRPERAVNPDGSPLRVGNRFLLDVEPEPGGDAMLQLCRVEKRRVKLTGPVEIEFTMETNQPAVPYVPAWTPPDIEEITVAAISHAQIIPFPLALNGGEPAVGVLASRGDDNTIGAEVLFDVDGGTGTFSQIGTQLGFAVRCQLAADYAADASGAVRLEIIDTRDQHLALSEPGASGAANNELLAIALKVDAEGFIDEDADGTPQMEIFSIETSAAVSGNTYDFTAGRSRLGTVARAWATGDTVWIVPRASLVAFAHANFPTYVHNGDELVFRLNPFSRDVEFEGELADLPFRFPGRWQNTPQIVWETPATTPYLLAANGQLTPAATVTDKDGNLVKLTLYSTRDDTGVQTKVVEVMFPPTAEMGVEDAFSLGGVAMPLTFAGREADDTYYLLTLRAEDEAGNVYESSRSLVRGATSGGGGMLPPVLDPASGYSFDEIAAVNMSVAAPASRIHYAMQSWTARTSNPPAAYSAFVGLSKGVQSTFPFRLWCRASSGAVNSAWVHGDYFVQRGSNL